MAFGPGKYDDICTQIREQVGITEETGGGIVVIVIGGRQGPGFAVQCDLQTTVILPDVLESVAKQMRRDVVG